MPEETITIQYDLFKGSTDNAVLLEIEGDEYWFPRSQIILDEDEQEVELPMWLAVDKGIY